MPKKNATAGSTSASSSDPRRWPRRCLIVYWAALLWLMHHPQPISVGVEFDWWDKAGHFVVYGLFTALVAWWVFAGFWPPQPGQAKRIRAAGMLIGVGVAGYALLDEATQPLTLRQFDIWDWAVDTTAALLVSAAITCFVLKRVPPEADQTPAGSL